MASLTTFGDLLRQLRKRAGMTQGDLAAAVGYSASFVCDLEQNRRQPTVGVVVQKFVPALGLQEEVAAAHLVELAALARGERPPSTPGIQRGVQSVATERTTLQPTRLPAQPTQLIGREQTVKMLCQRAQGHSGRLLTLVGPPGVGKTRLGLEVATRLEPLFKDGARFIALAPLSDPELVAEVLATELEVADSGKQSPQERLIQGLRHKEILLLLDNFEQITAAAPLLAILLAECPRLHLLVTSRERLHLRAEQRFPVPPLELAFAVELFVRCAQNHDPAFEPADLPPTMIPAICQRLDCLPLALELMAAQITMVSPQSLLTRLHDRRLDLLTDGAQDRPPSQRTLRNAIHRSYSLFGPEEQRLFRALGVFTSGFDLESVMDLGYAEKNLQTLVNRSMVQLEPPVDDQRRGLLLETLREYAYEQLLTHQELAAMQQQHAHYFLAMAESYSGVDTMQKHLAWMNRIERNLDNLQAALVWLIEKRCVEEALRMIVALHPFENDKFKPSMLRLHQVAIQLADEEWRLAPEALTGTLDPLLQQRVALFAYGLVCAAGAFTVVPWDYQRSSDLLDRSMLLDCLADVTQVTQVRLHIMFGYIDVARREHDYARMEALCNSILTLLPTLAIVSDLNEWRHKRLKTLALKLLGTCAMDRNDQLAREALATQLLPLLEELDDTDGIALLLLSQGDVALFNGQIKEAEDFLKRSLLYIRRMQRRNIWAENWATYKLGFVALHHGEVQNARMSFVAWIKYCYSNHGLWNVSYGIWGLADLAMFQKQSTLAAQLLGIADHLRQITPDYFPDFFHAAYESTITTTRTQLGESTYTSAYAQGYAMQADQAIAFALAHSDDENPESPSS